MKRHQPIMAAAGELTVGGYRPTKTDTLRDCRPGGWQTPRRRRLSGERARER